MPTARRGPASTVERAAVRLRLVPRFFWSRIEWFVADTTEARVSIAARDTRVSVAAKPTGLGLRYAGISGERTRHRLEHVPDGTLAHARFLSNLIHRSLVHDPVRDLPLEIGKSVNGSLMLPKDFGVSAKIVVVF